MAQATKAARPNLLARFNRYLKDVWAELKRVVWPSRSEVINSSIIVLVTLLFFVVFTLIVDEASTFIITALNHLGG